MDPPPVAAIVIVSVPAVVVIVTLSPPTNVNVSVALSATTSLCPDTDMVLKMLLLLFNRVAMLVKPVHHPPPQGFRL